MMYETSNGSYLLTHNENYQPKSRKLRGSFDEDTPLFPHRKFPVHTFTRRAILEKINEKHAEPSLRKLLKDVELMAEIEQSGVDKKLVIKMLFDKVI
jgi:hypothetical protein